MESARIASPNLLALNRLAAAAGVAVASFPRVLLDVFGRAWAKKSPAEGRALLHIRIQASDLVSTPDRRGTPHAHTMALTLALCQLPVGALLAGHAGARRWFLILFR